MKPVRRLVTGVDAQGKSYFTDDSSPLPGMHETETLDYAIVLSGEIVAIMDKEERLMKTGDILIQRGTNHAWANRSDAPCRICFVLIDGKR